MLTWGFRSAEFMNTSSEDTILHTCRLWGAIVQIIYCMCDYYVLDIHDVLFAITVYM